MQIKYNIFLNIVLAINMLHCLKDGNITHYELWLLQYLTYMAVGRV